MIDHNLIFYFVADDNICNQIHKLLKALHVCTRYTAITGRPLLPDVSYFGMCLLGNTSIHGFAETVAQSTKSAQLYLDVSG